MAETDRKDHGMPALEWLASFLGAGLALGLIGYIAWDGFTSSGRPADLVVEAGRVETTAGGVVTEIVVSNHGGETAAEVTVEGLVRDAAGRPLADRVTFDFVPGNSSRQGALIFPAGTAPPELRVTGYRQP